VVAVWLISDKQWSTLSYVYVTVCRYAILVFSLVWPILQCVGVLRTGLCSVMSRGMTYYFCIVFLFNFTSCSYKPKVSSHQLDKSQLFFLFLTVIHIMFASRQSEQNNLRLSTNFSDSIGSRYNLLVRVMQNMEYEELFDVIDELILGVYAAEILIKWYCSFSMFWRSGWNIFDFFIVVIMLAGVGKSILYCFVCIINWQYFPNYFSMDRATVVLLAKHCSLHCQVWLLSLYVVCRRRL